MKLRIALGSAGVLLLLFGVFRLLTQIANPDLVVLAYWLIGALILHDGVLSPTVVVIGGAISRVVPPRARRYLQGALVAGALITVIAIPMIYRENSQPRSKAILEQNFSGNLTLLLTIVAVVSLILYAAHTVRDGRRHPLPGAGAHRPSAANDLPPEDHSSVTE